MEGRILIRFHPLLDNREHSNKKKLQKNKKNKHGFTRESFCFVLPGLDKDLKKQRQRRGNYTWILV